MDEQTTQQNSENVKGRAPVIIALQNQKGGVGKTTVAQNLSIGLAQEGKRTLLIDLDPQTNATYGLGIVLEELGRSELSTAQLMNPYDSKVTLKDILLETGQENLWLAPADLALSTTSAMMHGANFKESILKNALRQVEGDFDYVLIDCPPSLDILPINAFVAADFVIIPVHPDGYGFKGLSDLLATITYLNKTSRADKSELQFRILFNQVSGSFSFDEILERASQREDSGDDADERERAEKRRYRKMVEILEPVSDKILKTVIRNSELFKTSQSIEMVQEEEGATTEKLVPVMMRPSHGTGRKNYQSLTKEVLGL